MASVTTPSMSKPESQAGGSHPPAPAGRPRRLGRGLGALIGEPVQIVADATNNVAEATSSAYRPEPRDSRPASDGRSLSWIGVDEIEPGPFQPRAVFSPEALRELADSIRVAGVMQPIVVRSRADGRFELIAGERRWRAARLAGLAVVPAVKTQLTDEEAAQWGLIENLQRQDLNPLEKARAFSRLADRFGLTHAQIAQRVGIDRVSVSNHLRLLELEGPILHLLESGSLSYGHSRALLAIPAGEARIALAKKAAEEGWSVRRIEALSASNPRRASTKTEIVPPGRTDIEAISRQISDQLGTKVRIRARSDGKRGRLMIDFYSLDHFDGLMEKLGVKLVL